ncbi:MAG TPA: RDD family protein [Puia sp.]|jgi:hypothetical protein|nr:RDD family protein [Puia sp.]
MAFATSLNRVNRLVSMLSDQVSMTFIVMIWWAPMFLYATSTTRHLGDFGFLSAAQSIYVAFIFSFYFNKDIYLGQSIGKRMLRFRVINKRTGEPAGPLRCLARNLPLVFWPLELILAMINVQERLGDYIAGTKLVNYERDTAAKPDWVGMAVALLLGFAFVYVVAMLPLYWLMQVMVRLRAGY